LSEKLHSLLEACKKEDRKSQKELFELLLPYLRNICYRYLQHYHFLDDTIQETFIRLFRHLQSFDASKGTVQSWAGKIAINCSLEQNRKAKNSQRVDDQNARQMAIPADAAQQLSADHILAILQKIPSDQRIVFMMHCVDGYSHSEIAQLLNIDERNSRKRLSRAREQLKEWLREEAPAPRSDEKKSSVA
jgi:RNA polymerase sigma-70 factor (ECF subfamily)